MNLKNKSTVKKRKSGWIFTGIAKKTQREKQNLQKSSSGKQVKRHRVERQVNKEGRRLGQTDKREIRRGKEKNTRSETDKR